MKDPVEQQVTGGLAELERVDLERVLANASPALKASLVRQYSDSSNDKLNFCSFLDTD